MRFVYVTINKDLYDLLYEKKEQIEKETGMELDWQRLDNKKASRILHCIPGLDFDNHDNYPQLMDVVINKVVRLRDVFKKYI